MTECIHSVHQAPTENKDQGTVLPPPPTAEQFL